MMTLSTHCHAKSGEQQFIQRKENQYYTTI